MLRLLTIYAALLSSVALLGCTKQEASASSDEQAQVVLKVESNHDGPISPLPQKLDLDLKKVALGRELFHDKRLSRDNTIACSSCHNLSEGGDDGKKFSTGIDKQLGTINSPTVFNCAFNSSQFWDGRAASLLEQVDGPIHSPIEMNSSYPEIIKKLKSDSDFVSRFKKSYPKGLSKNSIRDAIVTFEMSLITPDSPFDQFLRGNQSAMSEEALRGYHIFKDIGCIACHQGKNLGGNLYQTMGILKNYFEGKELTESDLGRFNVTKNPRDRHRFKVPSLRNVELTAPYFHDGSASTLDEAVRVMAEYQLGYDLTPQEVSEIVEFLKSLTGKIPE